MAVEVRPLAVDLCCGVSGWGAGLIAAGFHVLGFDIEDMFPVVGEEKPEHFSLCLQDIRSLNGRQFKDAALIVASPPCQFFSYTAMPWSRGKMLARTVRADPALLAERLELFNTCFRIQRETSEAAGRWIPMVVENVKGIQPWVGRARWNFGSFFLYGDVPANLPRAKQAHVKAPGVSWSKYGEPGYKAVAFNDEAIRQMDGRKVPGFRFDGSGRSFQTASVEGVKVASVEGRRTDVGNGARFASRDCGVEGEKMAKGGWFNDSDDPNRTALMSSKSPARKAASARIAKIPLALSTAVGQAYMSAYLTGKRVDLVPVQPDLWEE